jgi:hypothetical protein
MVATIPVRRAGSSMFRGRARAFTTAALAVTGSVSYSQSAVKILDNGAGNSTSIVMYCDDLVATSLSTGTWLRDRDSSAALSNCPIDYDMTWLIERSTDGGSNWSTYSTSTVTRPVKIKSGATTYTTADPNTDQSGLVGIMEIADTGDFRATLTVSVRYSDGTLTSASIVGGTVTCTAHSTVYHVDPDAGDDGSGDGSSGSPWASFANLPSSNDYAVAVQGGTTLTLTSQQAVRASTDLFFGSYGTGKFTVTTDGGFGASDPLFGANINGANDDIVRLSFSNCIFDMNGDAEAAIETYSSTTSSVVNGISVVNCDFQDPADDRYAIRLGWGNGDQQRHTGISVWRCAFLDPGASANWRQQVYIQATRVSAIGACTFAGTHDNTTFDHSCYVNVPEIFAGFWLNGAPNGTVGSSERGAVLNVSIAGTAGWVPTSPAANTDGFQIINIYDVDGTDSLNAIDISQAEFTPFDATVATPPEQVKYFDLVRIDGIYQSGGNNCVLMFNVKRAYVNNLVGDQLTRSCFRYGVNEDGFQDSGTDYDTIPEIRIGALYAYRCGQGAISIDPRARGTWDIDDELIVESSDTANDRETGKLDTDYMAGSTNVDAGGGIGPWIWHRTGTGDTIKFNNRGLDTVAIPASPGTVKDDDVAAPTGNADDTIIEEAGLLALNAAMTFTTGSPFTDAAADDFSFASSGDYDIAAPPAQEAAVLSYQGNTQITAYDGDIEVAQTFIDPGNWHFHARGDSYTTPSNTWMGRLWLALIGSASWRPGAMLLANQYTGAAGDYAFANNANRKFGQQPLCAFQHHLDVAAGPDYGDPVGLHIGNNDNFFSHYDSGSGALFARCFHLGGFVSIHSDATVTTIAPAQNEYYRHLIDSTHITRFALARNPFLTGTEDIGVRPIYLHPGPNAADRNAYTDNVSRTLCDLSGTAIGTDVAGSILDAGIEFRGNKASAFRDKTRGTSQAASTSPGPAELNTLYGTGDKATSLGDLIVEPVNNAYAWGIRHNSAGINTGDFLLAVGPQLVYRIDGSGDFVGGPVVTYQFGNSNSFADIGAGDSSGTNDGDQKNTHVDDDTDVLHHFNLGSDGITIVYMLAEEGVSLATIQTSIENALTAARAAFPGKQVHLLLWTNFMHLEDGTSEATMRTRIEGNRDHYRSLVSTLRGSGSNRADKVAHYSQYDAMLGYLLNGSSEAEDYLTLRGGTAFTRPGGGGPVDFTAAEYGSDLLDTFDLHINDDTGGTNDANRAGEFFAADALALLADAIESGGRIIRGGARRAFRRLF